MFVKFVKDYKKFKKDTIIKCNSLHGNALIKNGYAVKQGRCYKIKDLYIAELATVNRVPLGFQSITLKPEGYSIFLYNRNSSFLGDSQERGMFINILNGNEYFPSNHKDYLSFTQGMKVVIRESLMRYSSFFYADLYAKGLTDESYVSVSDLVYNEYKVRTKMQNRKKQPDDGVDYCF